MTTNASDSPTITVAGTIYAPDLTPAVTALVEELEQHGQYVVLSAPTDDIDDVVLRSGLRRTIGVEAIREALGVAPSAR